MTGVREATTRIPRGAVVAALVALVVFPYLPALLTGRAPFHRDISDHSYPLRLSIHRAWWDGRLPGWDGQLFCGSPLLAQPEASVFYPPNLALDWIHPSLTIVPQILLHLCIGAALLYLAVRARGLPRQAGVLSAAVFTLSGVGVMTVQQIANLRTIAWIPGAMLGVEWIRQGRWRLGVAGVGLFGGMSILGGYPPHFLYASLGLAALLLSDIAWSQGRGPVLRVLGVRLGALALGLAVAAAVGGVQILPTLHFAGMSQRALGLAPEFANSWAAQPAELLFFLFPRTDIQCGYATSGYGFVGYLALCLAALACARRRPGAVVIGATVLFLALVTLGGNTPVGAVLQHVPPFRFFRNPTHFLYVIALLLAVLAAEGVGALFDGVVRWRTALTIAACVLGLWVAGASVARPWAGMLVVRHAAFAVLSCTTFVLVAVRAWPRSPGTGAWLTAAVLAADLWTFEGRYNVRPELLRTPEQIRTNHPSLEAASAAAAERPGRVVTGDRQFNWDNSVVQAGLDNVRGLRALAPMRTFDVMRIANEGAPFPREPVREPLYDYTIQRLDSPIASLVGLRYACDFASAPASGWSHVGQGTFAGPGDGRLFRWFADVRVAGSDADVTSALARPDFDAASELWAVGAQDAAPPGTGPVPGLDVVDRETDVRIRLSDHGGGWLFWSQSYDEGWRVTLDGQAAPVVRAQHAFMAVRVPAGVVDVRWSYLPPGLIAGSIASIGGALACVWLLRRSRTARFVKRDAGLA